MSKKQKKESPEVIKLKESIKNLLYAESTLNREIKDLRRENQNLLEQRNMKDVEIRELRSAAHQFLEIVRWHINPETAKKAKEDFDPFSFNR